MVSIGVLPSRVRRRIYRRRGWRIADDVTFAPGSVIDADEVEIGPGCSFGLGTVIRGRSVRIGRRVDVGSFCFFDGRDIVLDDDCTIREQVFVGGPLLPRSLLNVGKRVKIFQTCFLNPTHPLRIGDDTGVGGRSSIFTHGSWQSAFSGYPVAFAPVTIGRNVWLPWHVFILPGVEIGDGATIGAGSVVNRSIPAGALAAGVPAKVLKLAEEWPRPIDEEAQWSLARSMFQEFLSFAADNGACIGSGETNQDRVTARFAYGAASAKIALVRRAADALPGDDLLVALDGVPCSGRTASWFSLVTCRKGGRRDDLAAEVEDFISRYGVRFTTVDEE